jgi:RHS repeat-associated protein
VKRLALLGVFFTFVSVPAFAQVAPDVQQGLIPFASFQHGDIDSVNLATGNLTVHIPLVSYPQRGGKLRLNFFIRYNNKGWYIYQSGTHYLWAYAGGTVDVVPDQPLYWTHKAVKVTDYDGSQFYQHYKNVLSRDGSSHEIASLNIGGGNAIDATGIVLAGSGGPVIGPDGVQYAGSENNSTNITSTDPNGNQIIQSSTGWTDTLGRVIPGSVPTDGTYGNFNYNVLTPGAPSTTANCPSGTASARAWNLPAFNGSTAVVKLCYADYAYQTSFNNPGVIEASGTYRLLKAVVLPNLTMWQFTYNSFLDLTSVSFPTGGSLTYGWQTNSIHTSRQLASRALNANDGTGNHTWTYQWRVVINNLYRNIVTDPAGNDVVNALCSNALALICQTDTYGGSRTSGTLLKTVSNQYHREDDPFVEYTQVDTDANVVLLSHTETWPGGKTSQTNTAYDSGFTYSIYHTVDGSTTYANGYYGLPVQQTFSDYGTNAPGPLLRQVATTYQWQGDSNFLGENLLNPPAISITSDGSGNKCAETDYAYDDPARLFTPTPAVTQNHVAAPGPKRGNISSITRKLSSTPCNPTATWQGITSYVNAYDTGTVYQSIDPLNHATTYAYSATYWGSLPTTVTNALGQAANYSYDFNTGLLTSTRDANNQTTSSSYDIMWRPIQINHPDTGQTTYCYTDMGGATCTQGSAPFSSVTTKKINSSANLTSVQLTDGLGRVIQTQLTSDLAGTDYTDTTYDALGRVATVSNPHRSTASPTDGTTTFLYDTLGRTTQVTRPDGATVLTTYIGPATESRDESRVTRISQSDGLSRLSSVCEVSSVTLIGTSGTPAACGQDIAATGFLTAYQYDALDNLTQVNQGRLNTRTFSYDSLSRLTSATNPESGTICYGTYSANVCQRNGYDANGNLTTKTDARRITTTYSYDALNRLTQKAYSDTTPKAAFNYDETAPWGWTLSNPIGRLTTIYTKNSSGGTIVSSLNSYDPMGRVAVYEQCQPLSCGPAPSLTLAYTYNLLGEPISMHPSQTNVFNFTLSYSYNSTAHLATITSSLNDANHPQTLFSGASYNAPALLTTATLGGIVNEHRSYNSRLWPTSITVDSSVYSYSMTSYAPNGNVLGVNDSVNGNWVYKYDDFNRLTCSNLSSNGTCAAPTNGTPTYTYDYDRFGNRWHQNGPQSMQLSFSGNNNRMDGYSYDDAGNLLNDGNYAYTYDAENRIIQVNLPGPGGALVATYTYDANGHRVSKTSGGVSLAYLYDTEGHVVVETNLNTSPAAWTRGEIFAVGRHIATYSGGSSGTTNFIETDWLGTERVRTNHSGAVCETITSLPFGDGHSTSTSCGDVSPLQFTGKERDNESGLDYFGVRYYGSAAGRFTSVDPIHVTRDRILDPQQFNLYAYTRNNPMKYVDPDGRYFVGTDGKRVAFTIDKGQITFGANASADLKRMTGLVSASGSATALAKFSAAAGNDTKIDFRIVTEKVDNGLGGLHQAQDKNGTPLKWVAGDNGTGHFDGTVAFITDKNGNNAYQGATVTVYEGNISNGNQAETESAMVGVFSHELEHDIDQQSIDAIKDRQEGRPNGYNVEKPAYDVGDQVNREIKEKKKEQQ